MPNGFYYSHSGSLITLMPGSILDIQGQMTVNGNAVAASATFSVAAGSANICDVTVTVVDSFGTAIAAVHNIDLWLSDASTGAGLTGTTASGTVTAASGGGAVYATHTAKKALRVQTKADGTFVLEITDTAKTGFYVAVAVAGRAVVSSQLVTGSYG